MDVRQRVEQVVGECLTKVCHVVLSARLVHGVRPSPPVRQGSAAWVSNLPRQLCFKAPSQISYVLPELCEASALCQRV